VADRPAAAGEGEQAGAPVPRDAKEIQSIRAMVSSALGIDEARGDKLEVSSMPFESALFEMASTESMEGPGFFQYLPFIKYGLLIVGAVLLYLLLARPMLRTLQGSSRVVTPMKTVEELEAELNRTEALPRPQSDPAERLRELAMQEQGAFAQIIKTWLREG
jgi:flagellar M-ring protein FliF